MDPLTRGSLFHKVQAEFYRALQKRGRAAGDARRRSPRRRRTLDAVLDRVAAEYAEKLAPAIDRVWRDEIDELRRDLGIWVQKIADEPDWHAGLLRVQLRPERRRARSAQPAGAGRWSTAASCCAARSI